MCKTAFSRARSIVFSFPTHRVGSCLSARGDGNEFLETVICHLSLRRLFGRLSMTEMTNDSFVYSTFERVCVFIYIIYIYIFIYIIYYISSAHALL